MEYREITEGLQTLVRSGRRHADIPLEKLNAMQEIYLQKHPDLYTPDEILQLRYYLKAISYKFHLTNLSLEQLWALSDIKRNGVFHALQNSLDRLDVSSDELLIISFVFEGFLLQTRTFLDFYMLYVCMFLKTGHRGSMSRNTFFTELKKVKQEPMATKAVQVAEYFNSKVFGSPNWNEMHPNDWGTLLVSLRDKIAHRDLLRPSFNSDETLVGGVLFDWPTLRNTTYDRFCQYIQNGMFAVFTSISPILYGLEWKAGPYKPDLWQ